MTQDECEHFILVLYHCVPSPIGIGTPTCGNITRLDDPGINVSMVEEVIQIDRPSFVLGK